MSKYNQSPRVGEATRFSSSPMAEVEYSKMTATPTWLVPFNAGDIVPIYYREVLPHETVDMSLDFVIRQTTLLRPTMGKMDIDIFAFWVPNRVVNESWKNVMGENTSSSWTAPSVSLAPLWKVGNDQSTRSVTIPVNSIADYYGFGTQAPIPVEVLEQCNDFKFRGYVDIYNNYYRSENYENPIPYSKLNVYNGFLVPLGERFSANGNLSAQASVLKANMVSDGSEYAGAITKALYGEGFTSDQVPEQAYDVIIPGRLSTFNALGKPLKANKLHDYFTSVLPSPQKGQEVYFGISGNANLVAGDSVNDLGGAVKLSYGGSEQTPNQSIRDLVAYFGPNSIAQGGKTGNLAMNTNRYTTESDVLQFVDGTNLQADLSQLGVSINDLRTAIATQSVYETLARGGSRYVSMLRSFFELDTESPFMDIPLKLGHIRRSLDLYQVAQTSQTESGSPQGTLSAYGYTNNGGHLFKRTFIEHGYIHVLAVVRQRNLYSTYLSPDNFRRSMLDFYLPQFANIGEQPIRLAQLNPFKADSMEKAIGYQEAWAEYRYEPDRVVGSMRSGINQSLDVWHYGDDYDPDFEFVNENWLKSNAEEVLNRTLAVTSDVAPQFKGQFRYTIHKQLPMPTYSVPGLDTI